MTSENPPSESLLPPGLLPEAGSPGNVPGAGTPRSALSAAALAGSPAAALFPEIFLDDVFTLETPRLFLRWPKASDVHAMVLKAGDARVATQHAALPHPFRREDGEAFVASAREGNAEGRGLQLAIALRGAPNTLIGCVGLRVRPEGTISLGYWLGVEHWGQGYATEAVQAIIDAAFLYTPMDELIAEVRVGNERSRRVLARSGFQYEGPGMCARPAFGDMVPTDGYRLTRSLWASLKGWRAPLPHGRDGIGRDGIGRDGIGRDGIGRDNAGT